MIDGEPILLIASVSAYEAENLELSLQPRGWSMRRVDHADHAAQQLRTCGRRVAVLVIDAGLLEMPHDGQWRRLRELHPRLATIVRCLLPKNRLPERLDGRTVELDPDDVDGICAVVRRFCLSFQPSDLSAPLQASRP